MTASLSALAVIPEREPFPQVLVPRAWAALCDRLRDPVRVREEKGIRTVDVLGCLRYLVLPSARQVRFGHGMGRGRFRLADAGGTVLLDPPLASNHWIAVFAADWLIGQGEMVAPSDLPDFIAAIRESPAAAQLTQRVQACRIAEKLRPAIARALALDARLLAAARLGLAAGDRAIVDSGDYMAAWRHEEAFAQLGRENPSLLRPYAGAAVAGMLGNHPEPVRDLKLAFGDVGVGDAGWRMLLGAARRSIEAAVSGSAHRDVFHPHAWALKACVQAGRVLPPEVIARLVSPNGREPGERRRLAVASLEEGFWPPFLRALGRRLSTVRGAEELRDFLDGEFEDVYDWLEWEEPEIDANQARAGWPWLLRQRRAWEERERQAALSQRESLRWQAPLREFSLGGFRVVALTDSFDLWEEGQAMRHCARTYAHWCVKGKALLFSIRRADGRRVATGSIGRVNGRWRPGPVRLFANRPAGPELVALARAYADACSAEDRGRFLEN